MRATLRPARATESQPHPEVAQTVELTVRRTVGGALVLQTKVLEVQVSRGDPTIVVACPEGLDPLEHHFDASIAWTSARGPMEYAVTTRPARRGRSRVWLLTLSGPLSGVQKREYFRADVSIPVVVSWTDGSAASSNGAEPHPHCLAGVVLDLSEGGLLASVSGVPPAVGTKVQSVLRIDDDDEIVHAATVVRHVSLASGTGVALAFADPSLHGDRLRQIAFEAERKRRRGD